MNANDLANAIRALAYEAGFAACRFARADIAPHAQQFDAWLERGAHGSMDYLVRTRRQREHPDRVLPGAKSVIVLAVDYRGGGGTLPTWREELRGRIAAYAAGEDYHLVIRARLQDLCAKLQSLDPAARYYASVDSGPVLERDWAWASGLGWFGRNTNILNASLGSWFFLAVVLTTLEIAPDPMHPARCGRCTRCIPACPTGALDEHYVLDSRLCISYWTIEHRGTIPPAIRAHLGEWVFGCDICQDVCPWNLKRARAGHVTPLLDLHPFLPDLLELTDEEFRRRYRRTALWRAKREGLARNAAVVLGNTQNPDAVRFLARCLRSERSPVIRAHAVWALGRLATKEAADALLAHRSVETDSGVLAEITQALHDVERAGNP
ncbi:MAG: epoxyqueuosine reductase [Candidatus Binatia bacterium]|nr:MAG: epoxyqueuosine reductase [Candidatus Binatia bacterium]